MFIKRISQLFMSKALRHDEQVKDLHDSEDFLFEVKGKLVTYVSSQNVK